MTPLRAWRVSAGFASAAEAHKAFRKSARSFRLSLRTYQSAEAGRYELREAVRRVLADLYSAPSATHLIITAPSTLAAKSGPVQPGPGRRSHLRRNTPFCRRRQAAQSKVPQNTTANKSEDVSKKWRDGQNQARQADENVSSATTKVGARPILASAETK